MVTSRAIIVHQTSVLRQHPLDFGNGFPFPVAGEILKRTKTHAAHTVHIKRARQMVDLVLQDARVPSGSPDDLRLPLGIETLDPDLARARYQGHQPWQAEASLEKLDLRFRFQRQHRVDDDLKGHGFTLPL